VGRDGHCTVADEGLRRGTWWQAALLAALIAAGVLAALAPVAATAAETEKKGPLTPTTVKDLHYGDVLFHYFQDDFFGALTRLRAAQQLKRVEHHAHDGELLLGGLYLSYGQHLEAGRIFESLLDESTPATVRNKAWFYLGKVWYQRGYWKQAEEALRRVQGTLPPSLDAEKHNLLASVLIYQGRFDDAVGVLNGWRGPADWMAYGQFNLGVALVRKGRMAEAVQMLDAVGQLRSSNSEMLALRDKANLALGYAYLQTDEPTNAKRVLERVRLEGPQSNKALLAVGWADSADERHRQSLVPWMELHGRRLLDAAVQESYLAVPYAFAKLDANAQAAEYYTTAIDSYASESTRIDESIAAIRAGRLIETIVAHDQDRVGGQQYGWFWQLENLPDAPESRYLYHLLAGHEFQEGLKSYRDINFMRRNLEEWARNIDAFNDMLFTRRLSYDQQVPKVDAALARDMPAELSRRRVDLESRLKEAEGAEDFVAFATPKEKEMWTTLRQMEDALAAHPDDASLDQTRDKVRLLKGVLYWQLNDAYKARVWNTKRSLKDLDGALKEMQKRWLQVERARSSLPTDTSAYAARVDALRPRIEGLSLRLADVARAQGEYLADIAIRELETQKERLANYQLQARFALAAIYDQSAELPAEQPPATPTQPPTTQP
jgi:hypothetical protein